MKILIVIPNMAAGGAERHIANLANLLAGNGWEVRLLTFLDQPSFYPLHGCTHIRCGAEISKRTQISFLLSSLRNVPCCLREIRQQLLVFRPDLVLSQLKEADLLVFLLLRQVHKTAKWVTGELNDPTERNRFVRALLRVIYRSSDLFICQTETVRHYYQKAPHSIVLPNLMDLSAFPDPTDEISGRIVTAGRLVPQKNHALLLRAFAAAVPALAEPACLTIFGEGPLRQELAELANALGISDQVHLPGVSASLWEEIRSAAVYISSSD